MNSLEFCDRYLPDYWAERDLQLLIQKRLQRWWFLAAPDELVIKTPSTSRRIDITTWLTVYEVKKWLTRDNIFHAVAQTELYTFYGPKLLWMFPKRRVVVGLAPTELSEYEQAARVARDFRRMGIEVIFLNEAGLTFEVPEIGAAFLIVGIIILVAAIAAYLLSGKLSL
ncbi:hypothetical protein [Dendronalium sp. ChiSLP03b]|uniref:hypothetical protein n=1 Tax=Dendronalium sp. ChiSLP03b TaxID=3075381 RepID=UPI002AD458BB|nr:hypothetical protein [Dendronalium sp. ChiSLP03b]MDZ8209045.1 hypothetical protein [Dendronalium sp. ChiSLP03b]